MKKFLSISCIVLVLDRIIKVLVQGLLSSDRLYIIKKFFYLVYVKNIGAAFSILEGKSILLILIGLVSLGFIYWYVKTNKPSNIGYALLFGGILGNLIDRIIFGYVIDFIGFEIGGYEFPIFNIADIAIVIGAVFIIIGSDKNENSSK
ncbi:MAG: signal peptidase II [Bacilli bacterium]|nr:signal peptidase II [Bacilli bacterium]